MPLLKKEARGYVHVHYSSKAYNTLQFGRCTRQGGNSIIHVHVRGVLQVLKEGTRKPKGGATSHYDDLAKALMAEQN